MRLRPVVLTGVTAACAVLFTLASTIPAIEFAARRPALHAAMETAAALAALLLTLLAVGRFFESCAPADLALACGLATLAATNLFLAAIPGALGRTHLSPFATWASLAGTLVAVGILAVAPFLSRTARMPQRALGFGLAAVAVTLSLVGGVAFALRHTLPLGISPGLDPRSVAEAHPTGNTFLLTGQGLAFVLCAVAALGFTLRARADGDDLYAWLGAAISVAAVARADYALFPSQYSDWVYTGDILRIAFYGLLLVGAAFEIARYHRKLADGAKSDERRRIARELHDGLGQELAYIVTQTALIQQQGWDTRRGAQLVASAERALDESRAAIEALTDAPGEPLADSLARAANETGARLGVHVRLDLQAELEVEGAAKQALARIVREALWNAGRHGHAHEVVVELVGRHPCVLRIVDDGVGFDPASVNGNGRRGHGLVSMRERSERLGGEFVLTSAPGRGTTLEVHLP